MTCSICPGCGTSVTAAFESAALSRALEVEH